MLRLKRKEALKPNFDKEFTSEAPVLTPINSVISAADQKEFDGFEYMSDWAFQGRLKLAGKS